MNSFKSVLAMAVGVALMIGVAALCPAQTGPITQPKATQPPPKQPEPISPPANQAPGADLGVLTPQALKMVLINLGYDPKEEKAGESMLYWIKVERGGVTYSVDMNISPNGEKIWAMVPLADVPANVELPAARLLKLLELNQTTVGPSHFAYIPANRQIYLNRALENRAVTPKMVKDLIDRVIGYCETTREHWEVSKWSEVKTGSAAK